MTSICISRRLNKRDCFRTRASFSNRSNRTIRTTRSTPRADSSDSSLAMPRAVRFTLTGPSRVETATPTVGLPPVELARKGMQKWYQPINQPTNQPTRQPINQ